MADNEDAPVPGSHRADALVDRYVTSDLPLRAIVDGLPGTRAPVVEAIVYLQDCLDGRVLARDAMGLAETVDLHGNDPELAAIFLALWADVSCRISRPTEAVALLHRAKAVIGAETHPEIRAMVDAVDARLADARGDKADSERILRSVLGVVSPHSPRRKFHTWELAALLAMQGRASEIEAELKDLAWRCNEHFPLERVLSVRFVNAVETGQARDASHLLAQITSSPLAARELKTHRFRGYPALLRLMHTAENAMPPQPDPTDPEWVKVPTALLARDHAKALAFARADVDRTLGAIMQSGFASCNLVRAELANGTWESPRRVIEMRRARGNPHYLDDLFLARVELLAGNRRKASEHFAATLDAVRRYSAQGRLDFELRLATEISRADLVHLSRTAPVTRPTPPPQMQSQRKEPAASARGLAAIEGNSAAIKAVKDSISRFAPLDAPVLITGETGVGKELVARAIHDLSPRREQPFIAVNCGTISDSLLESELFGHERGAFTGAEKATRGILDDAGRGTVFLDEIGNISPRLQGALLRVLENSEIRAVGSPRPRTVSCRIIAATNAPLERLADEKSFRQDLLFRLKRLEITVPPLRERREDIPILVRAFLDSGRPIGQHAVTTRPLSAVLRDYDWPGNVRELRNVIERMRLMHSDKLGYDVADADLKIRAARETPVPDDEAHETSASSSALPAADPIPRRPVPRNAHMVLASSNSPLRRMERLRSLFDQHARLTRSEVIQILGVSPNTATKDLKTLCGEGYVVRVEPSASSRSYYFEKTGPGGPSGDSNGAPPSDSPAG